MADGGHDDDRVDDVGGPGGAGDARGAAGALVVGQDVAAFEDPGDLMLGTATPGLGQDDDRDERPDGATVDITVGQSGTASNMTVIVQTAAGSDGSFHAVVPTPPGQSILTVTVTAGAHATGWAQQTLTGN